MEPVSVRPEKLRGVLATKLDDATHSLHEIREADKPRPSRGQDPRAIVGSFLLAARGVVPVARTYAQGVGPPKDFEAWLAGWERDGLPSDAERALWGRMGDERRAQEHGEGAGLVDTRIEITDDGGSIQNFQSSAAAHLALGIPYERPRAFKGGVRFAAYPDELASAVCGEYLGLCRRFVEAFLLAYAPESFQ